MANQEERRLILEMIANGKITAEQGLNLLQSLPADEPEELEQENTPLPEDRSQGISATSFEEPPVTQDQRSSPESTTSHSQDPSASEAVSEAKPDFTRWRGFWAIPFWIGVTITVASALLMVWAKQASGLGFWFFCSGVPFTLGIVLMVLGWQSRTARWLHLRVQQKPGEGPRNIAISFPLPLGISSWFLRTFHHRIPGMEGVSIDEVINVLEHSTTPDNPLFVEVEEDDGERVQIYIG